MSPKSMILLAMALGCGLVAAVGINQIMARPSDQVATAQVVVAKREIKKGDPIRPDDITVQDWPTDIVPQGAVDSVEKLQDKFTSQNILPGEALIDKKLYGRNEKRGIAPEIPPGYKAVAVKVDSGSGVSGLILPGDNVDLLLFLDANMSKGIPVSTTKSLLKNIKVLAADESIDRPEGGETAIQAKTVTLLVTSKQASIVTHAQQIGSIQLVIRGADSKEDGEEGDSAITTTEILNGSGGADVAGTLPGASAGIVPLPTVEEPKSNIPGQVTEGLANFRDLLKELNNTRTGGGSEAPKTFTVTLIEGPESRAIEFEGNSKLTDRQPILGAPPADEPADQPAEESSPADALLKG